MTTAPDIKLDSSDEAAIRGLFDQLTHYWNHGDAYGYASLFTENAIYIAVGGIKHDGREAIARGHQYIFDTFFKGSTLHGQITNLRLIRPDVAVAYRVGSVQTADQLTKSEHPETIQTLVVVNLPDGWRFAAFQNTEIEQHKGRKDP